MTCLSHWYFWWWCLHWACYHCMHLQRWHPHWLIGIVCIFGLVGNVGILGGSFLGLLTSRGLWAAGYPSIGLHLVAASSVTGSGYLMDWRINIASSVLTALSSLGLGDDIHLTCMCDVIVIFIHIWNSTLSWTYCMTCFCGSCICFSQPVTSLV